MKWSRLVIIAVLPSVIGGCTTPSELKQMSRAQLEVTSTLEEAVTKLALALDGYHRERAALIAAEGRVSLTREAIDISVRRSGDASVTVDELFDMSRDEVLAWVDNAVHGAFSSQASLHVQVATLKSHIAGLEAKLYQLPEGDERAKMNALLNAERNRLDDLRLALATKTAPPAKLADLEGVLRESIIREREHRQTVQQRISILRQQIALMNAMAKTVDMWLSIDVTVSQDQADALIRPLSHALREATR